MLSKMYCKIPLATSSFSLTEKGVTLLFGAKSVTLLVSAPNPTPLSLSEFNTIKSKFFFSSSISEYFPHNVEDN